MNFRVLAYFEIGTAVAYSAFQLVIAYLYPTVWSLVLGLIFGSLVSVAGSFSLGHIRHRFRLDPAHIKEIISFGKWITASSAVFFVTANLDRMYLPSVLALKTLGIFAIARTITDVVNNVFVRLNNSILFPFVASRGQSFPSAVRRELGGARGKFLFLAAASLGLLCATVDLLVFHLFDARYRDAGAMASVLLCGTWFAILSSTAEASLLGLGRPQVTAIANGAKLVWLLAVLPVATATYGIPAAIVAIAASDIVRYLATIPAQKRASFSFLLQDWCATAIMLLVTLAVVFARASFGMPLSVLGWLKI
jgi:O-antigen/teichoic acid export membrane protein